MSINYSNARDDAEKIFVDDSWRTARVATSSTKPTQIRELTTMRIELATADVPFSEDWGRLKEKFTLMKARAAEEAASVACKKDRP